MQKRDTTTYRKTDFTLSSTIERLYGKKDYKKIKSYHNLIKARNTYLKIAKSIRFAVEETIVITDSAHSQELQSLLKEIDSLLSSADNLGELDQRMISFQTELMFAIIGFCPSRLNLESTINKRDYWKLDLYRQIIYIQNDEQKKHVIFRAVQGKYASKFGDWGDFVLNIYHGKCNNSPTELIRYIKLNHPEMYIDLF